MNLGFILYDSLHVIHFMCFILNRVFVVVIACYAYAKLNSCLHAFTSYIKLGFLFETSKSPMFISLDYQEITPICGSCSSFLGERRFAYTWESLFISGKKRIPRVFLVSDPIKSELKETTTWNTQWNSFYKTHFVIFQSTFSIRSALISFFSSSVCCA